MAVLECTYYVMDPLSNIIDPSMESTWEWLRFIEVIPLPSICDVFERILPSLKNEENRLTHTQVGLFEEWEFFYRIYSLLFYFVWEHSRVTRAQSLKILLDFEHHFSHPKKRKICSLIPEQHWKIEFASFFSLPREHLLIFEWVSLFLQNRASFSEAWNSYTWRSFISFLCSQECTWSKSSEFYSLYEFELFLNQTNKIVRSTSSLLRQYNEENREEWIQHHSPN